MMRFPPRLKWDLAKVCIAPKFLAASRRPVDVAPQPGGYSRRTAKMLPSTGADLLARFVAEIWKFWRACRKRDAYRMGRRRHSAALPANRPPRAKSSISAATVFIEIDGTLLRRRIHEFRPVSRLYLVLPLNGLEAAHDLRAQHPGNFRATIESIRTAKLSGFHICVETKIFADTQLRRPSRASGIHSKARHRRLDPYLPTPFRSRPTHRRKTDGRKRSYS